MLYVYYKPTTPTAEKHRHDKSGPHEDLYIKLDDLGELRAYVDSEGLHSYTCFSDISDFQRVILADALLPYVSRVSFKIGLPRDIVRQDGIYIGDDDAKLTLFTKYSTNGNGQVLSLVAPTLKAAQVLLQKLLDGNILPSRPVSAEQQMPSYDALATTLPSLRLAADRLADQLMTTDRVLAYSSELLRQNHAVKESLLALLKRSGVAVPKDLHDAALSC